MTLNRVQVLGHGSSYRSTPAGRRHCVRGTTFALAGPMPTSVGNVVALACLADCGPRAPSAAARCSRSWASAWSSRRVRSPRGARPGPSSRDQGYFDAAIEGITTTEQAVTSGNPGQIAMGQQTASSKPAEGNTRKDSDKEEDQNQSNAPQQTTVTSILTPTGLITITLVWNTTADLDAHLSGPTPTGGGSMPTLATVTQFRTSPSIGTSSVAQDQRRSRSRPTYRPCSSRANTVTGSTISAAPDSRARRTRK